MKYKLKDIGTIITGTTPKTKNKDYYNRKDFLFVGPTDLKIGKYVRESEKYVSLKAYNDYSSRFIGKNSLMIDCIGSDMGNVSLSVDKVLTNQQINSITDINENNFNIEFLYYLFSTMKKYFHQIGTNGSTMPIINKTMFEEIEVEIPNKVIQDKIAYILSKIDMKIDYNIQTNNNLYELANQLYQKAFSKDKSIKWKKYNLTDIANINTGYSYKSSELVENSTTGMATIKNFERTGGFKVDGFKPLNPSKKKSSQYVNKFDVLVACTDLTQNADIIGNAVLLLSKGNYENIVISMDLVKVTSKVNYIDNFMIYAILNSKEFKNYAIGYTSGTTVLHLNKNCFKEFTIKLPEKNIIQNFIKEIKPIYLKISQTMEENRKLEQLRDTLLPKLMNGEIDLDKIEI